MMAAAHRPSTGSTADMPVKEGKSEVDLVIVAPPRPPTHTRTHTPLDGPEARDLEEQGRRNAASSASNNPSPSTPLQRWRPWKVVAGCFWLTVPTYGLLSSIGLLQTYWHTGVLQERSEGDIAWIISLFGFLDCLLAAPAGVLFDRYGTRWLLPLGCATYAAAFVGLAFCTTYAQFVGCMVVAGVAAAAPTTVAYSVVSQWFSARKGIATGCVTLGAPLGGIFFSPVLQSLFSRFSWNTTALILTGMMAAMLVLANLLVETNNVTVPPQQLANGEEEADLEPRAQLSHMLTSPKFWLVSYALFAYELVLFVQWGSIPSYAVAANVGNKQFYLMMSYNIGAVLGRTLPPWLSDRVLGPLNATILMNVLTLAVVLAIWIPCGGHSVAPLFVVVVLMGIGTGSFVPLGVSCINSLCNPKSTGTWLGSAYSIASFATLVGNPVSAVILDRCQSNGLLAFLAAVLFSGLVSAVALRWLCHGRKWVLKAKV